MLAALQCQSFIQSHFGSDHHDILYKRAHYLEDDPDGFL